MQKSLQTPEQKIKPLQEIEHVLEADRSNGLKIVQCHGVFDLLHPGHIRHFKLAKRLGDKLVVSITPDRFVNKGPGRPAFPESLRLESLAALEDVDYVTLNDSPDAISAIKKIKPTIYVKGSEYSNHKEDITGKIAEEAKAVTSFGGEVHYTDDIVFSSSSLLNRYFDTVPENIAEFIKKLKESYSVKDVLSKIDALSDLRVLIIGDAIVDEYQYVQQLGQTGKGLHMVGRCLDREVFLGGSLIIANHVAQFVNNVTLVTAVGKHCPCLNFIKQHLDPKVDPKFTYLEEMTTLIKKRYVLKDGKNLTKLFETYSGQDEALDKNQTQDIVDFLKEKAKDFDLVIACDFGNGFTNSRLTEAISDMPAFLALNSQTNSGNRGYNVVTNYLRANYISLNEPELRLAAHDRTSDLEGIVTDISQIMHCDTISITQGVKGVTCFHSNGEKMQIPPFSTSSVDRIGAGDSYLSLSSLCLAKGYPMILAGFIGSIAAGMSVQMVGNQEPIRKIPLCKFITRLMK